MATITECPANVWTKVLDGSKQFKIWPASKETNPTRYFWTAVGNLDPAPDNHDLSHAFDVERPGTEVNLNEVSDIYVMARLNDGAVYAQDNVRYDVNIQDQTTPPVEHFLSQEINEVTLVGTYEISANTLTFEAGHGFVVGNFFELRYFDDTTPLPRFTQVEVLTVVTNEITITPPIDFAITDLANVESSLRVTVDLNVVGSFASPQVFNMYPPNGTAWDLTRMMIGMILDGQPDDALFGSIAALTNGVYFGAENETTGGKKFLINIRANAGWRASAFDVAYTTRSGGGGSYGMSVRKSFAGSDKYGVAVRLHDNTEKGTIYIQDDLTDLVEFRIKVMGHEVD